MAVLALVVAGAVIVASHQSSSAARKVAARAPKAAGPTPAAAAPTPPAASHTPPAPAAPQAVASISSISQGRTIALGGTPGGLTADASGNIWVSFPGSGAVARVAPTTGQMQTFHVGGQPTAIAAAFDRIWVAGSSLAPLASLNILTGQPLSTTPLRSAPSAIAVNTSDQGVCTIDSTGVLTHLSSTGIVAGAAKLTHPATGVGCGEGWAWAVEPSPPALFRMSDVGGPARKFDGGPAPIAITFDQGVWIANRDGTVTAFNPALSQLRVDRRLTVAPELDGIYAVENDPSVWAFSRQTRSLYRISNTARPSDTATVVFNSPPVAIVRVAQSVWVATQDGHLTQINY